MDVATEHPRSRLPAVAGWLALLVPLFAGGAALIAGSPEGLIFFAFVEALAAAVVGGIVVGRKPEDPGWGFLLGVFVGAPLFAVGGLVAYFVTFMAALMFLEASG